jgi:hypothetical protein
MQHLGKSRRARRPSPTIRSDTPTSSHFHTDQSQKEWTRQDATRYRAETALAICRRGRRKSSTTAKEVCRVRTHSTPIIPARLVRHRRLTNPTDASDATLIKSNVLAISHVANVAQWVAQTNALTLLGIARSKSARSMPGSSLPNRALGCSGRFFK